MKTAKQILIEARAKIADPEHWTQGAFARNYTGSPCPARSGTAVRWCAVGAVLVFSYEEGLRQSRAAELAALHDAMERDIADFNDTHTHEEVIAAFDRAIAAQGE